MKTVGKNISKRLIMVFYLIGSLCLLLYYARGLEDSEIINQTKKQTFGTQSYGEDEMTEIIITLLNGEQYIILTPKKMQQTNPNLISENINFIRKNFIVLEEYDNEHPYMVAYEQKTNEMFLIFVDTDHLKMNPMYKPDGTIITYAEYLGE